MGIDVHKARLAEDLTLWMEMLLRCLLPSFLWRLRSILSFIGSNDRQSHTWVTNVSAVLYTSWKFAAHADRSWLGPVFGLPSLQSVMSIASYTM